MSEQVPTQMKAAAIDRFGPPEVLHVQRVPTPSPAPDEVLIRVDTAGIGVWDPEIRAGELDFGGDKKFPRILGNDGAGVVVAVGQKVRGFRPGDKVYSYAWKGGFYAEYAAIREDDVAPIPPALSVDEAGALGADGITALRGVEDALGVRQGERVLVFGASGGVGHLAAQLASRMGAQVFGVASGDDGVSLVRSLGIAGVAEGHSPELEGALRAFAPEGFDAALVLAGGRQADAALEHMKRGGRVAHPNGVEPVPRAPEGVGVKAYDGTPSPEGFARLNHWIGSRPFRVALGRLFSLEEAAEAHRAVTRHHVGKLALHVSHLE